MRRAPLLAVLVCTAAACDGESAPDDRAELRGPTFEVGLWPGEGIPVIEAVRAELALLERPRPGAPVVSRLTASQGDTVKYNSTRFQTLRPATVTVLSDTVVAGRDLGAISSLSRDDYYGDGFPDISVRLEAGARFEHLQDRAEGSCFVRIEARVIEASRCPTNDTVAFRTSGQPETRWWVRAHSATGAPGWVLVSDTTARVVGRRF